MKKPNIRIPWKQTVALMLFFATSFGVAATSLGFFSLPGEQADAGVTLAPFFPSSPSQTVGSSGTATTSPSTDSDQPVVLPENVIYLTNLSKAFNADVIEGYTTDRTKLSIAERVAAYNKLAGIIETDTERALVTYQSYTSDSHKLVKGVSIEGDYTDGIETVIRYTKQHSSEDGSYLTVATEYTIDRQKVQPYMGYLLLSHVELREIVLPPAQPEVPETPDIPTLPELPQVPGDPEVALPDLPEGGETSTASSEPQIVTQPVTVLTLCDSYGNVIIEDIGDKTPYYARDNQNRPVFSDEEGKLYAFDGEAFDEIKAVDLRVWLSYDYPAYPLGLYHDYEAEYNPETGVYRYKDHSNGSTKISTDYFKAFNFTENGLAVVVSEEDNALQVINRSKRIQFKAGGRYSYPTGVPGHNLSARNAFRMPDTFGIESIGTAGYDNGWLRIRVQALSQMSNSYGTVINDWYALVDAEGNYFDIPEGYTLEGYSDGVLLLAKDGLYGYYSIEGKWITQPIFTYARPFIQGLAVVGSETGTVGMIDTDGNIVLPFVYTSLSDLSSGVITAYCEGIGWETYYLVNQ